MNVARVQRKKIPLEIRVLALHSAYMSRDLFNNIRHRRGRIGEQVSITGLLKSIGRKIYLETAGCQPFACKP